MVFLWDNKIYLYEAIILGSLWPIYVIVNICFFSGNTKNQDNEILENEKLLTIQNTQDNLLEENKKYSKYKLIL